MRPAPMIELARSLSHWAAALRGDGGRRTARLPFQRRGRRSAAGESQHKHLALFRQAPLFE